MSSNVRSWSARVGLLGLLVLVTTGQGCSNEPDEGAYVTPPGFSLQQTRQVALQGHSFVRDENRQLLTATLAARRLTRKASGLDMNARLDKGNDRLKLEAVFHGDYADGMTVSVASHPAASLRVVPVNGQRASARLRDDGAVIAFDQAFPNVTSAFGGRDSRVEEFLLIPTEDDIPTLAYDLYPGEEFAKLEEEGGRLWAYASDGAGLFTIEPPVADDAAGKRVSGTWKLESSGNGYRITADIKLRGLAFPVLLDPTFETPQWFRNTSSQPSARAAAAGAFDLDTNCTLVFGGATNASFSLAQDLSVRCNDRIWKTGLAPATLPPKRAYSAMSYFGGSTKRVFLFGGYGVDSVLNDLWRADLTCTTPGVSSTCSVAWTQVTASNTGPSARYLHGMAWNGSKLMVFGGVDGAGAGLRDTWEYDADANTWAQLDSTSFGGSFGLYGFATATLPGAGGREVYVSGGYSNPSGGGAFLNAVQRWNGASNTWDDASGSDAVLPVTQTGTIATNQALSPDPRYLHWMAPTSGNRFLVGSGLTNDGSADSYFSDTWLWQDRSAEGFGFQWLRQPVPQSGLANAPGQRESATAVYDENRQELVLIGGLTASNSIINDGRTYRPAERSFTLTQSCTNTVNPTLCDGNQVTLTATFPGLTNVTTPTCASMQALFLRYDALLGTWGSVTGVTTAAFSGGVCSASTNATWDTNSISDYGVRVRDSRFVSGGSQCTNPGTEITAATPRAACIGATSTVGSASCGFAVDPSFISSTVCENF